jgi:hypothetical protein
MKKNFDVLLTRVVTSALFIAVLAGVWDTWWHGAIGRDTFFEPPHILLYLAVIVAIILGIYGYYKIRDKTWKWLAILLVLVPVSAPLDEVWHRIFGVEDISTIWAIWSPPHLVLIAAITGSLIMLLPLIKKDPNFRARRFFGSICLASILALIVLLTAPLDPTGPYKVLGFYGTIIMSLFIIGIMLISSKRLHGIARATFMTIIFILFGTISWFGGGVSSDIVIAPHDHAPIWLGIFSLLLPAVFVDAVRKTKMPNWLIGGIAGLLWGGILYGFSSMFFMPEFQYGLIEGSIAIFSALIGGLIAGILLSKK